MAKSARKYSKGGKIPKLRASNEQDGYDMNPYLGNDMYLPNPGAFEDYGVLGPQNLNMLKKNDPTLPTVTIKSKKHSLGSFLGDTGKGIADNALGLIGMNNVIPDSAYSNPNFAKGVDSISGVTSALAPMALNMVAPGAGTALKVAQKAGSSFNPQQNTSYNPVNMQAYGGKMKMYPGGGVIDPTTGQELPNSSTFVNQQMTTGLPIYNKDGTPVTNGGRAPLPAYLQGPSTTQAQRDAYYKGLGLDANGNPIHINAKGGWIQGAVNPEHKGYCSPMTKSTCTPHRKAFAMTMKKHHGFHDQGGNIGINNNIMDQDFIQHPMGNDFTNKHLTRYDMGGTHEENPNGGIPIGNEDLVEQGETRNGDYIFSDRLKVPGKKHTFSAASKKIENSYKNTKDEMRAEAKEKHLQNLQSSQEMVRNTIMDKSYKKAYGGKIGYDKGGNINYVQNGDSIPFSMIDPNNIYAPQPTDFLSSINGQAPQSTGAYNDPRNTNSPYQGQLYTVPGQPGYIDPNSNPTPSTGENPSSIGRIDNSIPQGKQKNTSINGKINPYIAGAQMLAPLSELMYGLKGGDKVNFDRINPTMMNPAAAKISASNAITEGYNGANNDLRNNNLTSGQYMNNRLQSAGAEANKRAGTLSDIQNQYDIANTSASNNAKGLNAQIQMQESIARQQEKDAARTYVTNGLNDLGQGASGINKDIQSNNWQNIIEQNMGTANYTIDPKTGKAVFKKSSKMGGKLKMKSC